VQFLEGDVDAPKRITRRIHGKPERRFVRSLSSARRICFATASASIRWRWSMLTTRGPNAGSTPGNRHGGHAR
jgi:hypothetical protein